MTITDNLDLVGVGGSTSRDDEKVKKVLTALPDLPDSLALVGIGGAGKELVFNTLEQDWILEHYLESTKSGSRSLRVYIIDTATAEHDADLKRREKIMKRVEEIERDNQESGGTVSLKVVCLTNVVAVNKPSDLTNSDVRQAVESRTKVWWLEDPERGLGGQFKKLEELDYGIDQDFAKGTYRRRAISKAVFYKAFSRADPMNFNVTGSEVAIVAGLGGGTGSGMFLDVARELKEGRGGANGVSLFAVLPTTEEFDIEKTNAYAALSEIEYAKLNGKSPFDYAFLLPFEPTEFNGTMGSRVKEFDDVFPYILASSYSLSGNMRGGAKIEKYTGFVLANGFIIRYGMEEILNIKKHIEDTIKYLHRAVEEEVKFRDVISNKLSVMETKVEKREANFLPEDSSYLANRLNTELKIWDKDAFKILGFDTVKHILYRIEDWESGGGRDPDITSFEDLMEYIENLESILHGINPGELKPRNEVDKELLSLISKVSSTIRNTGDQIRILAGMDVNIPTLSKVVKGRTPIPDDERSLTSSINAELMEIKRLKEDMATKSNDLKEIIKIPDESEKRATKICNILDPSIGTLWNLQMKFWNSRENINLLNEVVKKFIEEASGDVAQDARNFKDFRDSLGLGDIVKKLNELDELLPDHFDIREFLTDVAKYYFYKHKNKAEEDKKGGRFKRIGAAVFRGTKSRESRIEDLKLKMDKTFNSLQKKADGLDVKVTSNDIDININALITKRMTNRIDEKATEIVNYVKDKAGDEFGTNVRPMLDAAHSTLVNLNDEIKDYITRGFLEAENYEERKSALKGDIDNLNNKIIKSENKIDFLRLVKELAAETRGTINKTRKLLEIYRTNMKEMSDINDNDVGITRGEEVYINNVGPDLAVLAGLGNNSNLSNLFDSVAKPIKEKEINRIIGKTAGIIKDNLISRRYLGVEDIFVEYDAERWNFRMAATCISTQCDDIRSRVANKNVLRSLVSERLSLSQMGNANIKSYNTAGEWDVGLTLFALPVYLDNLRSLEGYKFAFDKRKKGNVVNILHHALLLEEGKIVYRKDTLKPVDAARTAKEETTGRDVSDKIIDMHEVVTFWEDNRDETRKET